MQQWLFSPTIHHLMTLIHITCALFWLGWMVYFSAFVVPVVRGVVPEVFYRLRAQLQTRTRRVVRWMIGLLVVTGVYNMHYRGLLDPHTLFYTPYGLRFMLKLFLALTLFGFYFSAPRFIPEDPSTRSDAGRGPSERGSRVVFVTVHGMALGIGLFVAYLGISLGG